MEEINDDLPNSSKSENSTRHHDQNNSPIENLFKYDLLPNHFNLHPDINAGIEILRSEVNTSSNETGGIFTKDISGKIHFKRVGISKDWAFDLKFVQLNENYIDTFNITLLHDLTTDRKPLTAFSSSVIPHAVFLSQELAAKHQDLIDMMTREGIKIFIDETPIAQAHTHPSGNMPSTGDFEHGAGDDGITEFVVSKDWTYLLVPTTDTPADSLSNLAPKRFTNIDSEEELRRSYPEHGEGATNAFRYNFLKENCPKYKVGFYTARKDDNTAERIF